MGYGRRGDSRGRRCRGRYRRRNGGDFRCRVADNGNGFSDRHRHALLGYQLLHYAAGVRLELYGSLVRFNVGNHLAAGYRFPLPFVPADYGALPHIVAHFGHYNGRCQSRLSLAVDCPALGVQGRFLDNFR